MKAAPVPVVVHAVFTPRQQLIEQRLCVPCTPSEVAAIFGITTHLARACLYQLQRQGRAVRLDRRVPKESTRGRQWEHLWSRA